MLSYDLILSGEDGEEETFCLFRCLIEKLNEEHRKFCKKARVNPQAIKFYCRGHQNVTPRFTYKISFFYFFF